MQVAIVDLGVGNLRSVEQAVRTVAPNANVLISSDAAQIGSSDRVVLPGQGAIGSWFRELDARDLRGAVMQAVTEKPLLGICVGMQALFRYCEEDGGLNGLDVFDGEVRHFRHFHAASIQPTPSIPQMGWNQVSQAAEHPLWHGIKNDAYFYFLHSYCANLSDGAAPDVVAGVADYHHRYIAAVTRGNVFATQFHPEKSHDDGLQLIKNFCLWNGKQG